VADAGNISIVASIMSGFEQPLTTYVSTTAASVARALEKPVTLGTTLYVVLFGLLTATGRIQQPVSQLLWDLVRLSIITTLVLSASDYNTFVSDLFFNTIPKEIGGLLLGGGTPSDMSSGKEFDILINKVVDSGMKIASEAGRLDVATKVWAYGFGAVGAVVITLIAVVLLYAKVGLALIIAVGPIFIALALFSPTRTYTQAWLSQLMNFTVLQILVYALFGLLLQLIGTHVKQVAAAGGGASFSLAMGAVGVFIFCLILATQLPSIAAAISGGGVALGGSLAGTALAVTRLGAAKVGGGAARAAAAGVRGGWNSAMRGVSALRGGNRITRG
jgi:type IV secretion system protein VirB6